jgi:transposase
MNSVRGLLREQGILVPVGAHHVGSRALELASDASSLLADSLRFVLFELVQEIREAERRLREVELRLGALERQNPLALRLRSVPGIGPITATALAGFVGDLRRFRSSRRFASYLGLTPNEHSSGSKRRLGAISKRGDGYLRMLLIHGARALLAAAPKQKSPDRLRTWALRLSDRVGHNKATVALANKLARYAWAVATREENFAIEKRAA